MNISITQLYALLTEKLDKDVAEHLTRYIDHKINQTMTDKTNHLASKEDLANTKSDILKWFIGLYIPLALLLAGLYFKN